MQLEMFKFATLRPLFFFCLSGNAGVGVGSTGAGDTCLLTFLMNFTFAGWAGAVGGDYLPLFTSTFVSTFISGDCLLDLFASDSCFTSDLATVFFASGLTSGELNTECSAIICYSTLENESIDCMICSFLIMAPLLFSCLTFKVLAPELILNDAGYDFILSFCEVWRSPFDGGLLDGYSLF